MDTLNAALKLVTKCQFALFPLHTIDEETGSCTCGSQSCHSPGKHPIADLAPNGFMNATTDPSQVQQWWSLWPDANIGIATGTASGVMVVDVDAKSGGVRSWDNLTGRHGDGDPTWTVQTGGRGYHYYYRHVDGMRNRTGFAPGIDLRADGGYVVAAPSLHKSGNRYEWMDGLKPSASFQQPAPAPEWLLRMLGERTERGRARPLPEKIGEGQRNDWLTSIAGTMRSRNMSKEAVEAALLIENQLRCAPPMDEQEVKRIAWSIDRYPAAQVVNLTAGGRRLSG